MHANERTLLASLGFADPDKKEPMHDLACRYLSTEPRIAHMFNIMFKPVAGRGDVVRMSGRCEEPIQKGDGKYRTTVGFADVILRRWVRTPCTGPKCCEPPFVARDLSHVPDEQLYAYDGHLIDGGRIGVEVKIHPVTWGELLRQVKMYREYSNRGPTLRDAWAAAVAFDVTDAYVDALKKEDIRILRLGDKFRAWAAEQRSAVKVTTEEV